MKRNIGKGWITVGALVLIFMVVGSALPGSAQNINAQQVSNQRESAGGPQESIKVHGHWTIVIRNEDGSVASRHEFNNALNDGTFLSKLLSREATVQANSYSVFLNLHPDGTHGDQICATTFRDNVLPAVCKIREGAANPGDPDSFYGLTATVVNGKLRLTGSAKASFPGTITFVTTGLNYCIGGNPACSFAVFTGRDLTQPESPSTTPAPPINVVAGQTIDVTVTISFS